MRMWLGFLMLASAWAVDVKTDAAPGVNLAKYQTFAWRGAKTGQSLLDARVHAAVEKQLASKGWRQSEDRPEVMITYRMREKPRTTRMSTGTGMGRWGGGGMRTTTESQELEGTLVLEMRDAKTKNVVWRMIGTDRGSSAIEVESEKNIGKMMEKAFAHFPASRAGE
jgi:hypothetical protein